MSADMTLPISYFGKLPSRGDFIKAAANNHQLIARLDQWTGEALELLARDVAWKQLYDLGQPVHFALMGSRSHVVIAGHLMPSQDASGRRYPFITAVSLEAPEPLAFIARAPLALARLWVKLERASQAANSADDAQPMLQQLSAEPAKVNANAKMLDVPFQDFLETQTLGSLQALLDKQQQPVSVRRILLALGILLQPVMSAGSAGMGKGLVLPLPEDSLARNQVACFWMDLLAGFLGRADFRILQLQRQNGPAILALGFKGFEGRSLQAMYDPQQLQSGFILLYDPDWVDDHIAKDPALNKLATYTEHEDLALSTARSTFRETFLGA